MLIRAIVYQPAEPILIADNDRNCLDASCGAARWSWPCNVQELENSIERSVILSQGPKLRAPLAELQADARETGGGTLAEMKREYIVQIFQETNGVVSAAAIRLGVPRTTLNAMMRKLGISRKDL